MLRKIVRCYTVEESVSIRETGKRRQMRLGKSKDNWDGSIHRFCAGL